MKVSTFFKILNRKIEKYDKLASNPFSTPQQVILIWIEDESVEPAQDVFSDNQEPDFPFRT